MATPISSPITFTSDEPVKLQQLEQQAQGFTNFKNAVTRSLSVGQDAAIISNLLQFLDNMVNQSIQQMEQIKQEAQARSTAPKEVKPEAEKKSEKVKEKKAS